jgi:hypothetical protein
MNGQRLDNRSKKHEPQLKRRGSDFPEPGFRQNNRIWTNRKPYAQTFRLKEVPVGRRQQAQGRVSQSVAHSMQHQQPTSAALEALLQPVT